MGASGVSDLLRGIAQNKAPSAVVLQGTDSYLRDLCRNALINKYVPEGAREWALAQISARGSGLQEALGRAQMLPMLARQQLIIMDDVESIEELGEKNREAAVSLLEAYFKDPAPFTVLVLEAKTLDGRLRLAKVLQKYALVVSLTMDDAQAAALAISTAQEFGVTLDRDAANLLVEAIDASPARIRMEVAKLAAFALESKRITLKDVEQLVVSARKHTVWEMADMFAAGRRRDALEHIDTLLRDGEQPPGLIGVLSWMYRRIGEENERGFGRKRIGEGMTALADADSLVKSGVKNQRAVVEFLIARLSTKRT